jgi:chromosome segregation ATPase
MDIEGTIQFIVSQQAQFAADIMTLKTRMDDLQAGLDHLRETVSQLTGVVSELAISQQNTNAILENLAERAVESSERQDRMDERLNTLISIVERHVSNHP